MDKDLVVSGQNFDDILAIVSNARLRAAQAVNAELINMYWEIGSYISQRVKNMGWGTQCSSRFFRFFAKTRSLLQRFFRAKHLAHEAILRNILPK